MNTNEIPEYLNRNLICRKIFVGVYPANKTPELRRLPALIVCNTDISSGPVNIGSYFMLTKTIEEHTLTRWVDFRLNGLRYFRCELYSVDLEWEALQSVISKLCGHYCIFYCLYRCREADVRKLAKIFTKDTSVNDSIVHNFGCKF